MASASPIDVDIDLAVAQAKADIALILTTQFQRELNNLRDALERANKENKTLKTENANLKRRLQAIPADDADGELDMNALQEELETEFCRPPPEGAIFSNGGPYIPSRSDRAHGDVLKTQLNEWTQARGYSVKIMRSKLTGARVKLVVTCVLAGKPRRMLDEATRRQRETQGYRVNKPRTSKLRDCPLRFHLQEIVQHSGTFVVQHSELAEHQQCNHEPDPTIGEVEVAT